MLNRGFRHLRTRTRSALYCAGAFYEEHPMKSISAVGGLIVIVTVASIGARPPGPPAPGAGQPRAGAQPPYYPERFDWQHKRPEEVGMSAALVSEAVQAAVSAELPNN